MKQKMFEPHLYNENLRFFWPEARYIINPVPSENNTKLITYFRIIEMGKLYVPSNLPR